MKRNNKRNRISNIAKVTAVLLTAAMLLGVVMPAAAAYAATETEDPSGEYESEEFQSEEETGEDESGEAESSEAETSEAETSEAETKESTKPFPDLEKTGTITVTTTMNGKKVEINDGSFELYQVALAEVDNGFVYRYTGEFSSLGTDPITEADLASDLAETLKAFVEEKNLTSTPVNIKGGVVKYTTLPGTSTKLYPGVYLIMQRDSEASEGYKTVSPFLVTIPYYYQNDKNVWEVTYDVDAAPKMQELNKLGPCITDPPVMKKVTGDTDDTARTFQFKFSALDGAPMPEGVTGTEMVLEATVAKGETSAETEAGEITFDNPGEYSYTFEEINNGIENYTYDNSKYYLNYEVTAGTDSLVISHIDVRKNGENGDIVYSADPKAKSANPEAVKYAFVNKYTKKEQETTKRRKIPETTPHDRPTTSPATETPTVLGESRVPEVPQVPQAVLGASRLPQTGQLWWPVPVLAVAGIALMAGGLVKRRSEE